MASWITADLINGKSIASQVWNWISDGYDAINGICVIKVIIDCLSCEWEDTTLHCSSFSLCSSKWHTTSSQTLVTVAVVLEKALCHKHTVGLLCANTIENSVKTVILCNITILNNSFALFWCKAEFLTWLLQSSLSHYPSTVIHLIQDSLEILFL